MTNQLIAQARRKYLAANPVRMKSVPTVNGTTGKPNGGTMTFPDIGDVQIIGCKLGMEFLAICHDDDLVEDWIHVAMGVVKDPEMLGILLANVFRGMNTVIGSMTDRAGLREHLQRQAVDAWTRDFTKGFGE